MVSVLAGSVIARGFDAWTTIYWQYT